MDVNSLINEIRTVLSGMEFPASKDAVLQTAQDKGASPPAVNALKQLPSGVFGNLEDLIDQLLQGDAAQEIGKML